MPDITKCTNGECPLSHSCYRFTCESSGYSQSYAKFEPQINEELDEVECEMYMIDLKSKK